MRKRRHVHHLHYYWRLSCSRRPLEHRIDFLPPAVALALLWPCLGDSKRLAKPTVALEMEREGKDLGQRQSVILRLPKIATELSIIDSTYIYILILSMIVVGRRIWECTVSNATTLRVCWRKCQHVSSVLLSISEFIRCVMIDVHLQKRLRYCASVLPLPHTPLNDSMISSGLAYSGAVLQRNHNESSKL